MAGQPTKIGKYDVLREIGRGGMGKVYAAVDPTIGRMVAIKQVTAVVSDDPDLLKRFYREAQSTGKLQHPNIVTLHDLGEQDGIPYLVMEYLEGDSLEKIIQERRPYTVAEKLNIILQVCEGLGYAHQRQIIHRDIKPGNVVVLNDGGVKIVDFGIAQFGNERYTRTGQVVGSLYYMSPEQIQDADIDSRSDIYSTGIVLFEFLTGSVPFRGKDPASTLAKILHDSPASVANSVEIYAAELDAVIRRALAKDRNTRYTSMEDFAFDLRSLQEKLSQDLIANFLLAAETFIGARQWDKAREQLRQILKLDKQHRRANELLREAQTQIQRQQVTEQVRQLRQRADEALGLRNWDEALGLLDQAIKVDGSNTELIRYRDSVYRSSAMLTDALRRAESAHHAGDLDGAKRAVEEALTVDPYNTTAKALNAILSKEISERSKRKKVEELAVAARKEIALRHFTSALEMLRAAEAVDASAAEVQQLIRSAMAGIEHDRRRAALEKACGEIEDLLNRDEYSAACEKADAALLIFPQDLGLLKLKGFAEKQREAWNRRQFLEAQIATARQLAESGELPRAQRILNEALERYPEDSGVISLLGIVTDGIARQEAERREAERQANEKRRYIRMQLEGAAALQQAGQTAEALEKIREGLTHLPDSEELKSRASALQESLAREEAVRKRTEQDAQQKRAEIEKAIAESWQLLSSKQTGQAVAMLDQALRRHPDSADLKSQLEFAQRRLAVTKAERERAEQEARRNAAAIQREVAAAEQMLDSRQTDQAVAALQQAMSRHADSEELKSLLQTAYRRQTAERAERELAEQALWQSRSEIEGEIAAAQELLEAKRTSESVARLEQALSRYPGSEELKQQLAYARQRLVGEEAARKKAEEDTRRRRAWVDAEITMTRQFVADKQADRAVTKLQQALGQYPENEVLKAELESVKRRAAQERAEREQAEQEAGGKREAIKQAIRNGVELLDAGKTAEAVRNLESAILRFPESKEVRSQLDLAKSRFAEEAAEKQRIAEEAQRRQAEIARALLSARQFLESDETSHAVSALELAFQRYPDSGDLKLQLEGARKQLAAEETERKKGELENWRKLEEVKKEIASATRLLDAGQLAQAVTSLEGSLRRIPESEELKTQLKRAKDRVVEEAAAKQRSEEEKRRRAAEIAEAVTSARKLLDSRQTSKAAAGLEQAARNYPESEELRSLLTAAQATLAQERTAQEKAEREGQERRQKIASQVESAKQLLKTNQTAQALSVLKAGLARYPESEELRSQFTAAQERQAREIAERENAEKRQEQLQAERAKAKALLDSGDPEKALGMAESALRSLGKDAPLQQLIDSAKAAIKQKKRDAERQQAEEQKRQRERDLTELRNMAAPALSGAKRPALEKQLRKADEIAARHPNDAEFQQALIAANSALQPAPRAPAQPQTSENRLATKFFTTEKVEEAPVFPAPVQAPRVPANATLQELLPKLLNKWTVIGAAALIVVGIGLKLLLSSKPTGPVTYVVDVQSDPSGATVQVENQTCVTPHCHLKLPAGEHELKAQLQGYQQLSQTVSVDPQNPISQLKLVLVVPPPVETAGFLVIKAGLEGADVLINGNKRSQTIGGGTLRLPLDPGTYSVEVEKKGYASAKSANVQISKGQETAIEFTLPPLPAAAELPAGQVDWQRVKNSKNIDDIEQFLGKYPASVHRAEALDRVEDLYWAKDNSSDNAAALRDYLRRYPGGKHVQTANAGLERLDWQSIASSKDPTTLQNYLRTYPSGEYHDRAYTRLDDLLWERTGRGDDSGSLRSYLETFPTGRHVEQARRELDQLTAPKETANTKQHNASVEPPPLSNGSTNGTTTLAPTNDKIAILGVLSGYEQSYENEDLRSLRSLWPSMSEQQIQGVGDFFKHASSVKLTCIPGSPKISGGEATLEFKQELTYVMNGAFQKPDRSKVNMKLKKDSQGAWRIESIH